MELQGQLGPDDGDAIVKDDLGEPLAQEQRQLTVGVGEGGEGDVQVASELRHRYELVVGTLILSNFSVWH